jgi:hypothetical protein
MPNVSAKRLQGLPGGFPDVFLLCPGMCKPFIEVSIEGVFAAWRFCPLLWHQHYDSGYSPVDCHNPIVTKVGGVMTL